MVYCNANKGDFGSFDADEEKEMIIEHLLAAPAQLKPLKLMLLLFVFSGSRLEPFRNTQTSEPSNK